MAIRKRIPYEQCPLCEEKEFSVVRQVEVPLRDLAEYPIERKLQWQQCAGCGHVYAHGHWPMETMQLIWKHSPALQLEVQKDRIAWARIVEKVMFCVPELDVEQKFHEGAVRWLDVGCAEGVGVSVAQEYGFEALGVDCREEHTKMAKPWGVEIVTSEFEAFAETAKHGKQTWDVIVLSEFLEHQVSPVRELERAKGLLRPGGVIYASCPSRDSLPWKVRDAAFLGGVQLPNVHNAEQWEQIEHYHAFSREHLEDAFRRAGLEPVAFHVGERWFESMEVIGR